jgi:RNA polymerase sigma-70 factor (ECF subfamily)
MKQMVSAIDNKSVGIERIPVLHAEQTLLLLAKNGDGEAYTELYRLHAKTVFRTVLRITGNREDAEDVLQEASMKALIHLKGFDGRSKFSTWLTRIAINSALMMRRKTRNRIEMSIEPDYESGSGTTFQVPDQAPDPERRMHIAERNIHLNRAVKRLSTTLREPLELRLKRDLSLNELAVELGISVPATKSRLLRAREKVRSSLMGSMRIRPADHSAAISGLRPAQRGRRS